MSLNVDRKAKHELVVGGMGSAFEGQHRSTPPVGGPEVIIR